MSEKLQKTRINQLKTTIADIRQCLPYADGQAYYNDKRYMDELIMELLQLETKITKITNNINELEQLIITENREPTPDEHLRLRDMQTEIIRLNK